MKSLLTDSRIETMMKVGHFGAVEYFVSNPIRLDQSWNSYKIASRHGYVPEDWGIWSDLIRLLDRCGRDIRSTRYICPTDLTTEHDKWLDKVTSAEEKHKSKGQLIRAKEEDFLKSKSCYFGIVISDKDIEVSVLDSIEACQAEGTAMHHCVLKCEYFAQEDSIVLSAHDKSGNRIETVEFSLTENRVVQSRGRCNTNTEHHDRIVNLVNANAHRFIEARASA
ncbi:PcfJ domain-containing protein [Paramuribaculum intestinale]|uniref:PcfJ domain-containing protein n=1 Tax=Paramuribaculum intestinale TaxID=2094151 RepID=UPI0025A9D061|nr:PcfJ domain-containing protein [Paramuribaculum intestinale]